MSKRVLVNLGFEYELRGLRPPVLDSVERRFAHILRLVPGWEAANPVTDDYPLSAADVVCAWGVTERTRDWLGYSPPSVEAVHAANDKATGLRIASDLGVGLPGATTIDTSAQALEIASDGKTWIFKHPLGVSGRERCEARAGVITPSDLRWLQRQLAEGPVVAEPRCDITRELSAHFLIEPPGGTERGDVRYLGATEVLTDARGTHRGNVAGPAIALPDGWLDVMLAAALQVGELGYWGPMSIDGFLGPGLERPISEINARHSFGRLTLEISGRLAPGATVTWHHPATRHAPDRNLEPLPAGGGVSGASGPIASGAYRLWNWADPNGGSGTWVQLSDSDRIRGTQN